MNIGSFKDAVHQNAIDKGWYEGKPRSFGELISLVHCELSEAVEEHRNGRGFTEVYYDENGKPQGVPIELADTIIRILDMCGYYGIDIEKSLLEKHAYNTTRPHRHGGKVI